MKTYVISLSAAFGRPAQYTEHAGSFPTAVSQAVRRYKKDVGFTNRLLKKGVLKIFVEVF